MVITATSSSKKALPIDGVLLVGRAEEADLRFDVSSVSRRHAKFIVTRGAVRVADLDSHNGTQVNGETLNGARALGVGDVITMGDITFVMLAEARPLTKPFLDARELRTELAVVCDRALNQGASVTVLIVFLGEGGASREALEERVQSELERGDFAGWSGPRELAVVLCDCAGEAASSAARSLLTALEEITPAARAGLATFPSDGGDIDGLLAGARAAAQAASRGRTGAAGETATELRFGDRTVILADATMIRLFDLARKLAVTDLPVLIQGETGSGKENIALCIHHTSERAKKSLVTLNCAAVPDNLAESELFGYEPGAFSEARVSKPGLVERAHGGTLFLDEIAELSERVQAKILRVLEAKRVTRLGDVRERPVDLRIVAATHRDLEAEVRAKRFREDLLFRLRAATVTLPPLRQRPREIPILARRFLADERARLKRPPIQLSDAVLAVLTTHELRGNVRELKYTMEYAAAVADGHRVELWDLPAHFRSGEEPERGERPRNEPAPREPPEEAPQRRTPLAEELRALERSRIEEALALSGGVQIRAAELLGMPIRTLTFKMRQHNIAARARRQP